MLVFPQLVTGASALYPVTKGSIQRTVVNVLADGRTDLFPDGDGTSLGWELHASGMTASEWNAVEALFQAAGGQWQTFTFLDPAGNLLAQSETFGPSPWTNGALIGLTTGMTDPFGTARATRAINAGSAPGAIAQSAAVPGNFQYCLSVWARTIGGSNVTLTASTTGASTSRVFVLNGQWSRISLRVNLAQTTTSVTFGAQMDAGASVDLFGMQVEAQLAASDYKVTEVQSGVYPKARFAADQIAVTAQGTDVFDAVIRIVNMEN